MRRFILLSFLVFFCIKNVTAQKKNMLVSELNEEELYCYGFLKTAISQKVKDSTSIHFFTHVTIEDKRDYYTMKTFIYDDSVRLVYGYEYVGHTSTAYSGEIKFNKKAVMKGSFATNNPRRAGTEQAEKSRYPIDIVEPSKHAHLMPKHSLSRYKKLFSTFSNKPYSKSKYERKVIFKYRTEGNTTDFGIYNTLNKDANERTKSAYRLNTKAYAIIQKNYNTYGIVNAKNEIITPFVYEYLKPMTHFYNLFLAQKDKKYGIITKNNEVVLDIKYNRLRPLSSKIALVISGDLCAIYNLEKRKFITKFELLKVSTGEYSASVLDNKRRGKLIVILKNEKFGAIDEDGNIIIPMKYDNLNFDFITQSYNATLGDEVFTYSKDGEIKD